MWNSQQSNYFQGSSLLKKWKVFHFLSLSLFLIQISFLRKEYLKQNTLFYLIKSSKLIVTGSYLTYIIFLKKDDADI